MKFAESLNVPIQFKLNQFQIILALAMTINISPEYLHEALIVVGTASINTPILP